MLGLELDASKSSKVHGRREKHERHTMALDDEEESRSDIVRSDFVPLRKQPSHFWFRASGFGFSFKCKRRTK